MRQIDHFMVGESPTPTRKHQVWNPSTGEIQAEVALGDAALLEKAIATAKQVQPGWAASNPERSLIVVPEFPQSMGPAGACKARPFP